MEWLVSRLWGPSEYDDDSVLASDEIDGGVSPRANAHVNHNHADFDENGPEEGFNANGRVQGLHSSGTMGRKLGGRAGLRVRVCVHMRAGLFCEKGCACVWFALCAVERVRMRPHVWRWWYPSEAAAALLYACGVNE